MIGEPASCIDGRSNPNSLILGRNRTGMHAGHGKDRTFRRSIPAGSRRLALKLRSSFDDVGFQRFGA